MTRKAHYVLSTHWDREWYQTFQDFRYRLVQLLDRALDGWQREELCGPFQTDGQAIVLEDYLEIRPERAEQIRELVKDGRFAAGPWYVMPDEFLVSGESLIRNLQMGRNTVRRLGGSPSNAGFICDIFGHNSQMPQIFTGFGIRGAFLWRGINLVDEHLFRWRGADGTEIPCYRFGKVGYCSFAAQVRAAHQAAPRPDEAEIEARLREFLEEENQKTKVGPLLLFDGGDHLEWDPDVYRVLEKYFNQPGSANGDLPFEIVHTSLDAYLDELLAKDEIGPVLEGELREPAFYPGAVDEQWLIPGVLSSRVKIKQANAACQTLLCHWAEPVNAFASRALGLEYPQGYLNVAWKWLIQNHPHDSICGCSIDSVHEDMFYRFHQCEQIAARVTTEAARRIAASVEGEIGEDELRVVVFNPLARDQEGVVDLELELPVSWPTFSEMGNFEPKPAFRIFDADGSEIHYQRTGQAMNQVRFRTFDMTFPQAYHVNLVKVSLPLRLPAFGYTTLTVRPEKSGAPTRIPGSGGLATSSRSMQNEHLTVAFAPDGALEILDRRTGQRYQDLLTFEDCADIGDGWNFGPAVNDQVFYSSGSHTSLALVHNGPHQATFRVRKIMDVPECFQFDTMTRSEKMGRLIIDNLISLRAGADWVEVETTVQNEVKDHRLRVLFPSGAKASTCLMDTPFDVVERNISLREDNHLYREPEIETKPQQTFTAVFDAERGLAVVSPGLLECAVRDLPERPLALTLFRATRKTVFTGGEPGGQEQGQLHFRYWIVPLAGEPDRARLFELGQKLASGLQVVHLDRAGAGRLRAGQPHQGRAMPPAAGFLSVEGPAVVTSLRQAASGGLELRLFNPYNTSVEAALDFSCQPPEMEPPQLAQPVDFESSPVGEPLPITNRRAGIALGPKQIRTLRLD
ncbi:MAG: glycoside hydrolase family 38 [Chloroflexi bacterium]|nr:glycoside hydrolase family 38 [Chloroflexota bacterium]